MSIAFIRRRMAAARSFLPSSSRLATVGRLVCLGFLAVMLQGIASPSVRADLVFGTINTSATGSGFGSFDISNPSGSPGSYSYAWTSVLSNQPSLADLARDSTSGTMYLMEDPYGSKSLRSITTAGAMTTLGTTTDSIYSMAFDNTTGGLYAYSLTAANPWQELNPASGATLAAGTLTGSQTSPYVAFGGNMTGAAGGGLYLASDFSSGELIKITPSGANASTTIVGLMTGTAFDPDEPVSPFVWGTTLHLINANRLYTVNESDASLTLLGTVTGLPGDFTRFTGAVAPVAVPEPFSLVPLATLGAALGLRVVRGRRLRSHDRRP